MISPWRRFVAQWCRFFHQWHWEFDTRGNVVVCRKCGREWEQKL